ncbi:MAG: response regulator transcription factor [Bacteroidetes bacterium]|nr:response regulator transcription factor [Bacteroidota bacterium]
MTDKKIRIAIVDDHRIVIDGIVALLKGNDSIEVVATNISAIAMLQTLESLPIDLLLTDIVMPEMNGDDFARKVKKLFPEIRILALSMSGQGDTIDGLINDADICGYVLKNISKQELIDAIQKIAAGGIYFSEEVLKELEKYSDQRKNTDTINITNREKEIILLIEKEYSNKQIAESLFISERTVETHRKNIFRKTNTNSVIGLIKYAYLHKLI